MNTELQKQIAERKVQADERGIADKIVQVALHLGVGYVDQANMDDIVTDMVYNKYVALDDIAGAVGMPVARFKPLKIVYHSSKSTSFRESDGKAWTVMELSLDSKVVFAERGTVLTSYIPGPWEEDLDRLQAVASTAASKAVVAARKKTEAEEAEQVVETKKLWGLA